MRELSYHEPGTHGKRKAKSLLLKKTTLTQRKLIKMCVPITDRDYWRPKTRGDCFTFDRPCPFVGCLYHLFLDVNPRTGTIALNFPDLEPWELEETCALDVADRGEATLEATGQYLQLCKERIRQIVEKATTKLSQIEDLVFLELAEKTHRTGSITPPDYLRKERIHYPEPLQSTPIPPWLRLVHCVVEDDGLPDELLPHAK